MTKPNEPGTRYHVAQSVRGALLNWKKRDWERNLVDGAGRPVGAYASKQYMLDQLAQGREVIPLTHEPCAGFSYKTGCPGHPVVTP